MNNPTSDPITGPCETCGQTAELIPYMDYAGCGSAVIELWRCPDGHVRYGDKIMGQATCDFDPPTSTNQE
ncbi:hypothetical protein ACFLYO_11100 [Chloroflexota bacterium]